MEDIYVRQKLAYSQLNLPHGSKQTNEETENKNRDAQKKRSSHKAVESVQRYQITEENLKHQKTDRTWENCLRV